MEFPRRAYIWFDSWAGRTRHTINVIAETPKRYKIQWPQKIYQHAAGSISYVPKDIIHFL